MRRTASLVALVALAACGGGGDDGSSSSADTSGCFLAFNAQFNGFRAWTSFHYDAPSAVGDAGPVHVAGPRTEYIARPPAHASAAFPVGTVIVKEVGANDPANHHLFAMVKRGCGFNAAGAKGWEWMELTETSGGATILWRGVGPPSGETYGGDPTGCNGCHAACGDNDSVCSPSIRLTSF